MTLFFYFLKRKVARKTGVPASKIEKSQEKDLDSQEKLRNQQENSKSRKKKIQSYKNSRQFIVKKGF